MVSVIVTTANARDALLATVDSILHQSYRDFELLIADDGSTDNTGSEVLARFGPDPSKVKNVWSDSLREETGSRSIQMKRRGVLIHYLQHEFPRGSGRARNRAVGLAGGEYLCFAEAGDIWQARKLGALVGLMDAHRSIAACLEGSPTRKGKKVLDRKRFLLTPVEFEEILECLGRRVSGSIVRRACLDLASPFDENLPFC